MNIVHEVNQLEQGGVERIVTNIIRYDTKNHHTVISYKEGPYRKKLEDVGADVKVVKKDDEFDIKCDLIHIHTGGGDSNLASVCNTGFPVIETIHSPVRSKIPNDKVTKRIGVTNTVSNLNTNCSTIYNGIDENEIGTKQSNHSLREELGIPQDAFVVGRIGRLGLDKGVEDFLLTCKRLQEVQKADIYIVIVGGEAINNKGYLGKLKLMAESLPVKNIKWVGWQENVSSYYHMFDLFLYPSSYEGFGLVFIEALFAGTPVVTYDTEVNREVLGNEVYYAKNNNINDLCQRTLVAYAEIKANGSLPTSKWEFLSKYTAERMSKEYQELYEQFN